MERRFACTVCGKCCYGWLPLSITDALSHAHRFPLAVLWGTVRQGAKAFDLTEKLGIRLDKKTALRITPIAYLPPSFQCPALGEDMRCTIHEEKPVRCRTMPFSADREMSDQADLLIPRSGWLCNTQPDAPVVYRDGKIQDATDFNRERQVLQDQATTIQSYAAFLLKSAPSLKAQLDKQAKRPAGGQIVLKILPLLRKVADFDLAFFAARQALVLKDILARLPETPEFNEYRKSYVDGLEEMDRMLISAKGTI